MKPAPKLTTSKGVTTHVHEVTTRTPDWFDWLTVALPVVVTLITFFLAYRLNDWVEQRRERKRLMDVKEYFLALAEYLANVADSQSNLIQDAVDRIQALNQADITSRIHNELSTSRIKSIPELDLYRITALNKTHTVKDNTKSLIDLSSALDAIEVMKVSIENINKTVLGNVVDYSKASNELILNIRAYAESIPSKVKENSELGKDSTESVKLHNIYVMCNADFLKKIAEEKIASLDINKRHEYFAKALLERMNDIKQDDENRNCVRNIIKLTLEYEHLMSSNKSTIEAFNKLIIEFKNVSAEIKVICEYFRK